MFILVKIFIEDEEACFFSNVDELIQKIKFLMNNKVLREKIAKAGYSKVIKNKHDIYSRVKNFVNEINL